MTSNRPAPDPDPLRPHVSSIFLPTDFSPGAHTAFLHALKIALVTKSKLTVLHVDARDEASHWSDFPGVRETLERWKMLPEGSKKRDLWRLGFDVQKVVAQKKKPIVACREVIERETPDLIILATHQEGGRAGWFGSHEHDHLAEPLARAAGEMTLFIPHDSQGFVDADSGATKLENILVPVASQPRPQRAVDAAARVAHSVNAGGLEIDLLHVGSEDDMPRLAIPENDEASWNQVAIEGDVVDVIVHEAHAREADLVVMTTDGPHGFLDALRGSTTERVMRELNCPLLAIPPGA